jgi:type II secretory pathway pseudopilin PulG
MKKGFSLIEALFVVITVTLVLGGIFGVAYKAQVSFDEERRFTETSQQARVAIDEITRYIRQAGNDPLKCLKSGPSGPLPAIQRDSVQQIQIRTDITGSYHGPGAPTGDPDGKLLSPFEWVTIGYNSGTKQVYLIDHNLPAASQTQVLADGIANFGFSCQNSAGGLAANDFDIAAVDVLIVAKTQRRSVNRINTVRYRSHVFIRSKTFDVFATN